MLNQSLIDELNAKVRELLAKTPARDLETNMRAMLASTVPVLVEALRVMR